MARPGLKSPPRHAVVVRGGDAPLTDEIPVARSSVPPPPPVEEAPISLSEKETLRAIPKTPKLPSIAPDPSDAAAPSSSHDSERAAASLSPVVESLPPPSDSPFVSSERAPASRSRRIGSRWTIGAAAAAGLILGFASVLGTMRPRGAAHAPEPAVTLATVEPIVAAAPAASVPSASTSAAVERNAAAPAARPAQVSPPAPRPAPVAGAKKPIF
jgi:hypothetical protein